MRALRRKRAKEEYYHINKKAKKKNLFILSDETDSKLKREADKVDPISYYKENIFGREDFYLYRGIMHFYIGEYEQSIKDYEDSIKAKNELKED